MYKTQNPAKLNSASLFKNNTDLTRPQTNKLICKNTSNTISAANYFIRIEGGSVPK